LPKPPKYAIFEGLRLNKPDRPLAKPSKTIAKLPLGSRAQKNEISEKKIKPAPPHIGPQLQLQLLSVVFFCCISLNIKIK